MRKQDGFRVFEQRGTAREENRLLKWSIFLTPFSVVKHKTAIVQGENIDCYRVAKHHCMTGKTKCHIRLEGTSRGLLQY